MIFHYYPDTDSLYIDLSGKTGADVIEASPDIVLDIDEQKNLVGIDVQNASRVIDLTNLEMISMPITNLMMKKEKTA